MAPRDQKIAQLIAVLQEYVAKEHTGKLHAEITFTGGGVRTMKVYEVVRVKDGL